MRNLAEGLLLGQIRSAWRGLSIASRLHDSQMGDEVPRMFILKSLSLVGSRQWGKRQRKEVMSEESPGVTANDQVLSQLMSGCLVSILQGLYSLTSFSLM